jgi:hypothetical protein
MTIELNPNLFEPEINIKPVKSGDRLKREVREMKQIIEQIEGEFGVTVRYGVNEYNCAVDFFAAEVTGHSQMGWLFTR